MTVRSRGAQHAAYQVLVAAQGIFVNSVWYKTYTNLSL